jgi:hypothetical protein
LAPRRAAPERFAGTAPLASGSLPLCSTLASSGAALTAARRFRTPAWAEAPLEAPVCVALAWGTLPLDRFPFATAPLDTSSVAAFVAALFVAALFVAALFVAALFVAALFVAALFVAALFVAAFFVAAFFVAAFFVAALFASAPGVVRVVRFAAPVPRAGGASAWFSFALLPDARVTLAEALRSFALPPAA